MMSGRFKDVSLLGGGEMSSRPSSFCDGRAAAIDRMDGREHQIASSSETIINDTQLLFVKRRDYYCDGVSPCC